MAEHDHPAITIAGGENAVRCAVGQGQIGVYITHDIIITRMDHFADGSVQSLSKAMDRKQFRAFLDALNKIALRAHI